MKVPLYYNPETGQDTFIKPRKTMALGPGKYDDTCEEIRLKHKAQFTLLVIINGDRGNGISAKVAIPDGYKFSLTDHDRKIAQILREVADGIERNSSGLV